MAGWFGRKPATDRAVTERIRGWAAAVHAAGAGAGEAAAHFSVNEIICRDPGCPGAETVILVMQPGVRTRAVKISGAMAEVTEAAVRDAFAGADES